MSHFVILVVSPTRPNEAELETILLPWHEYECTGIDAFIEWVDKTDEARTEWETESHERYRMHGDDGPGVSRYDKDQLKLYRPATDAEMKEIGIPIGSGSTGKISYQTVYGEQYPGGKKTLVFDPLGYEEVQIPLSKIYPTVEAYAKDWHGWGTNAEGKIGYLTNPNAHWDWYAVGGRWSGLLKPIVGATGAVKGKPGLMGAEEDPDGVDQARKSDVDFAGMQRRSAVGLSTQWDTAQLEYAANPHIGMSFVEARVRMLEIHEELLKTRAEQDDPKPMHELIKQHTEGAILREKIGGWGSPDLEPADRESWVQEHSGFSMYAYVRDGEWHQQGTMGWWGMSHDEKDEDLWSRQFGDMLFDVPDDHWLTIVDCHI